MLDFSAVTFISSSGLRVILAITKRLKSSGGRIAICAPKKQVKEILDITGCTTLLDVYPTVEAAKAHLSMQ